MTVPSTRAECVQGPRPCPHERCRHHLASDTGISSRHFKLRVIPGPASCVLDLVHENGPMPLDHIGKVLGVSREFVRQLEVRGLDKLAAFDAMGEQAAALRLGPIVRSAGHQPGTSGRCRPVARPFATSQSRQLLIIAVLSGRSENVAGNQPRLLVIM